MMSRQIPESDWQVLRQLKPLLLDRFCERVLTDVVEVASSAGKGYHKCYLRIYRLLQDQDNVLAQAFNDIRRSNALAKLAIMRSLGLLTDEEFMRFRPGTRTWVNELVSVSRP